MTSQNKSIKSFIITASSGTFGLRVVELILSFVITFLLTNNMSEKGYGAFIYTFSWINLLATISAFGYEKYLNREVPVLLNEKKHSQIGGLIAYTNIFTFLLSASICLFVYFLFDENNFVKFSLIALILISLMINNQGILRGYGKIIKGQVALSVIRPLVFVAIIIYLLMNPNTILNTKDIVYYNVIAFAIAFVVMVALFVGSTPKSIFKAKPQLFSSKWTKGGLAFLFINSIIIIHQQTDVIMLGEISGTTDVATYNVASKIANIASFPLYAFNITIAGVVAKHWSLKQTNIIQQIITKGYRTIFMVTLILAAAMIFFGEWGLTFFGEHYLSSYPPLIILLVAALFDTAAGDGSFLLMMTGFTKEASIGMVISAILNITLNFILIPDMGPKGAALASGISIVAWNLGMVYFVKKKTNLHPTVLGRLI